MSNKVKYGLKNVYYAVANEAVPTAITYGTPIAIPGAVNLSLSPAGDPVEFYADDSAYYEENVNEGYEGNIEIALIPDSFRVDVLGDTIDTNGAIVENANAAQKKFALMFEFNGDSKKTRHVLYRVTAKRPNVEGSTKTNTKEPKTEGMDLTARPALDTGDVKAKLEQDKTGYSTFFTAVYLKNAVTNTVASETASFSKAALADVVINATSTDVTNAVKDVKLNGTSIGGANMTYTGVDATIIDDYLTTLTNGTYTVLVEFVKGNAVTVTLTVTA